MGYEDLGAPQSGNERVLMDMLGATYELGAPQSRVEYLLQLIYENGGTGGGDVSGVKGAIETTFRKGNVNLALTNITDVDNGVFYDVVNKVLKGVQYDVLPTATADLTDKIYQYIGATTTDYTSGHFYKCVLDGSSYIWQDTQSDANALTPQQIDDLLALLG